MYILAVEDYIIFHDFMYEASVGQERGQKVLGNTRRRNMPQSSSAQNQNRGAGNQSSQRPVTEEDLI